MVRTSLYLKTPWILLTVLFLMGCAKEDTPGELGNTTSNFAGMAAFNGIEGSEGMEIRIDGKSLNKDNERFSTGQFINHRTVFPGKRVLEMREREGGRAGTTDEFDFHAGTLYTFFFYDAGSMEYIVTEDDLLKPQNGHARFRVVNLIHDAKINMKLKSSSINFTHRFDEPVRKTEELPIEQMSITVSADHQRYEPLSLTFEPNPHSINTLVLYADGDGLSTKKTLAYRVIELGK